MSALSPTSYLNIWPFSLIRGEPNLGPLEHAYRQATLQADISQIIGLASIYMVALAVYGFIDYQLFGLSNTLLILYGGRGLMLALAVGMLLLLRRTTTYRQADWVSLLWALAVVGFALYVHFTRVQSFFTNIIINLILVIAIYTVLPNRFLFRLIPAALLSVGDILLVWNIENGLGTADLRGVTLAIVIGNVVGSTISVHLYTYRRNQFKAQHEERLARAEVERLATLDSLTQVCNRRRFMELAQSEFQRFQRYQRRFSLLLMDLDYFKRVNDTFGHAAGDAVLRDFATLGRSLIRENDQLGRLGGEEFALLLPETAARDAGQIAERLRTHCEQMAVATRSGPLHVTISIGVTEVQLTDASVEDTLHRADEALYAAKAQGRNRVHLPSVD